MIISPIDSPSRGYDTTSVPQSFTPLTFSEMIEYAEEYEKCKSPLAKFNHDIEWVKRKFSDWKKISLIDLDYYIFLLKRISISSDNEFRVEHNCSDCGAPNTLVLDYSDIRVPINLEYDIKGSIVLNDKSYIYRIPNLEKFDQVNKKISRFKKVTEIKLIKLISAFEDFDTRSNEIEAVVLNAVIDDVVRLMTLDSMYFNNELELNHKCSSCGEGLWSISIHSLIDNLFQSLLLSRHAIETKITTKSFSEIG